MFTTGVRADVIRGIPAGVYGRFEDLDFFSGNFRSADLFEEDFRFSSKHGTTNTFELFRHGVIMAPWGMEEQGGIALF